MASAAGNFLQALRSRFARRPATADAGSVPKRPRKPLRVHPGARTVISLDGQWFKMVHASASAQGRVIRRFFAKSVAGLGDAEVAKLLMETIGSDESFYPGLILLSNPSQFTTVRISSLPSTQPAEIRQIVDLQAERYTPYAKEEILIGFKAIDRDPAGYSRVLVVISHRDVVQRAVSMVEGMGWPVSGVGCDLEGLVHWFQMTRGGGASKGTVLLADLDWETTTVLVLQNGQPYFHRSVACGMAHLTSDAQGGTATLIGEFQRSMEAFEGEGFNLTLSEVVLTGQAERMPAVAEQVQKGLNLPTRILSPFERCPVSQEAGPAQAMESGVSFTGLIGLALGPLGLDLTPPAVKLRLAFESRARVLVTLGSQMVMVMLLLLCLAVEKTIKLDRYHAGLLRQQELVSEPSGRVASALDQIHLAQDRLARRGKLLDMTVAIARILPPEIQLNSLVFSSGESVVLKGISSELPKVYELTTGLGKLQLFTQVVAKRTSKRKVEDKDVTDFEILCSLSPPAEKEKAEKP